MKMKKNLILAGIVTNIGIIVILICIYIGLPKAQALDTGSSRQKYYTSYQIQPGDNLYKIARKYMTEEYSSEKEYIKEVKSINGFSGNTIYAGAYLVVPYFK